MQTSALKYFGSLRTLLIIVAVLSVCSLLWGTSHINNRARFVNEEKYSIDRLAVVVEQHNKVDASVVEQQNVITSAVEQHYAVTSSPVEQHNAITSAAVEQYNEFEFSAVKQHNVIESITVEQHKAITSAAVEQYNEFESIAAEQHKAITSAVEQDSKAASAAMEQHIVISTSPVEQHNEITSSPVEQHDEITSSALEQHDVITPAVEQHNDITSALEQHDAVTTEESSHKEIVIWTKFFESMEVWDDIFKRIKSGQCEESRCIISYDRDNVENADAVLFNAYDLSLQGKKPVLPSVRNDNQIYIFYSMESPKRMQPWPFKRLGNYFNWTMTYRKDSDVVEPFGLVTKRTIPRSRSEVPFVTQEELEKKRTVAWMASHCTKQAYRYKYIQDLKRYMNIEIFGKCGKLCDKGRSIGIYGKDVGFSSCEREMSNFVFYLAFENSFCNEYVTEKIYKAWTLGVIPVVMGAVNYSSIAPPKSFIDVRDFKAPSVLAAYLKKVASDADLYNEYFEWQMYYDFEVGSPYNALTCDLCKKLHTLDPSQEKKSYANIVNWFFDKSSCTKGY